MELLFVTTFIYQIYQSGEVVDYLNPLSPYVHFFSIHTHNRHMRYPHSSKSNILIINKLTFWGRKTFDSYLSVFISQQLTQAFLPDRL